MAPAMDSQAKDGSFKETIHLVVEDAAVDAVPEKYRGTMADKQDMTMLGKKQVLRRNFKFATMVGFASTVIVSWEILLP